MTLKTIQKLFFEQLEGVHPKEEVASFFYILCDFFLKYSRFQVSLNHETKISEAHLSAFKSAIDRLKKQEPIQYILGETEFYGLPFKVTKDTLIPRPETEELVAWILSDLAGNVNEYSLLDIGTGSGCIAISLAKFVDKASVSGIDNSAGAIQVASQNAQLNEVSVTFLEQDVLELTSLPQQYDIVVSNPPYVRELEKAAMKENVLDFEPETALFVSNEDPLIFYRKIAQLAFKDLKPNGWLYFEINEYLGIEMQELVKEIGFKNSELKKDFREVPRMLKCQKI